MATELAKRAHRLGLDAMNVSEASPETVLAFAEAVLEELAARGLVAGEMDVGCWAAPRSSQN